MVTIVVEDGTGLPTANSFLSVADADDILALNIHSSWATQENTTKELLLMWATRLLCERATWYGTRVSDTSALPFPRSDLQDPDGVYYPDDAVPDPVKTATAMLADHLLANDPTLANTSRNLKRLDVDVIKMQFDVYQSVEKWPTAIAQTLRDFGRFNLSNTGGKRIIKH